MNKSEMFWNRCSLCQFHFCTLAQVTALKPEPVQLKRRANQVEFISTRELAHEIYQHKIALCSSRVTYDCHMRFENDLLRGKASVIAKQYGVSPKTIWDIWNYKTWYEATFRLWDTRFFDHDDSIIRELPMVCMIEEAIDLDN